MGNGKLWYNEIFWASFILLSQNGTSSRDTLFISQRTNTQQSQCPEAVTYYYYSLDEVTGKEL